MIAEGMPKSKRGGKRKMEDKDAVKLPDLSATPRSLAFPSLLVSLTSAPSNSNPLPLPTFGNVSTPTLFGASTTSASSQHSWMDEKKEKSEEKSDVVESKEEGATLVAIPSARRHSPLSFLGMRSSGRVSARSPPTPTLPLENVRAFPSSTSVRKEQSEGKEEESGELQLPPSSSLRGLLPRQPLFNTSLSSATSLARSSSFSKVPSYRDDTLRFDIESLVQENTPPHRDKKRANEESEIKKKRVPLTEKVNGIKGKNDDVEEEGSHVTNSPVASKKNAVSERVPLSRDGAATRVEALKRPPKPIPKGPSKGKSGRGNAPVEAMLEVPLLRPCTAPNVRPSEGIQHGLYPTPPGSTTASQIVPRGKRDEVDEEVKKKIGQLNPKKSRQPSPLVQAKVEIPDEPSDHHGFNINDYRRRSEFVSSHPFPVRLGSPQEGRKTAMHPTPPVERNAPPSRPPTYETAKWGSSPIRSSEVIGVTAGSERKGSETLWEEEVRHSADEWGRESEDEHPNDDGKRERKLPRDEGMDEDEEKKKKKSTRLPPPLHPRPPLCSRGSSPPLMKNAWVEESSPRASTDTTNLRVTQEKAAEVEGKREEGDPILFALSSSSSRVESMPVQNDSPSQGSALEEQEEENVVDSDRSHESEDAQEGGNGVQQAERKERGDFEQDDGRVDLAMAYRWVNEAEIVDEAEGTKRAGHEAMGETGVEEEKENTAASGSFSPHAPLSSSSEAVSSSNAPFRRRMRQPVLDYRSPQAPSFAIMSGSWSDDDWSGSDEREGEEEEDDENWDDELSAIMQQIVLISK